METVVNEWLRELIDYEWLSVSSFESKVGRKWEVKIKHYGNNKSNGKKRTLNAVQKVSEEHPNEISKSIIIMSAMLAQERLRHAEHLLTYISSDILLLLSVWL